MVGPGTRAPECRRHVFLLERDGRPECICGQGGIEWLEWIERAPVVELLPPVRVILHANANMGTCAHCRAAPATLTSNGPMIWYPGGRGLYRPKKDLCVGCARLPLETIWPVTHPNDCRQPYRAA